MLRETLFIRVVGIPSFILYTRHERCGAARMPDRDRGHLGRNRRHEPRFDRRVDQCESRRRRGDPTVSTLKSRLSKPSRRDNRTVIRRIAQLSLGGLHKTYFHRCLHGRSGLRTQSACRARRSAAPRAFSRDHAPHFHLLLSFRPRRLLFLLSVHLHGARL